MAVVWLDSALDDLEEIDAWLATLENSIPGLARRRIGEAVQLLERLGDIGRPGVEAGTRELSVRSAPYLVVYRLDGSDIEVLAVYHTSQDR